MAAGWHALLYREEAEFIKCFILNKFLLITVGCQYNTVQILWYCIHFPCWRHQMETFSALLAFCLGNSPVTGEFPSQRPVTKSFDDFLDLHLNKWLSKQSWGGWFETPSCSLWRHCNAFIWRLGTCIWKSTGVPNLQMSWDDSTSMIGYQNGSPKNSHQMTFPIQSICIESWFRILCVFELTASYFHGWYCDGLLTHIPSVPHICQWIRSALAQIMACHLDGTKLLSKPMLAYCQLDSWEQVSVKFEWEFYHFHSRKCIWNFRLPKWQPFCPGEMS